MGTVFQKYFKVEEEFRRLICETLPNNFFAFFSHFGCGFCFVLFCYCFKLICILTSQKNVANSLHVVAVVVVQLALQHCCKRVEQQRCCAFYHPEAEVKKNLKPRCCKTRSNVGGKTLNIAIQLVLHAALLQTKLHVFSCPF